MTATDEDIEERGAFDAEARRLCPDDTCIGLIGPDGRCKVCGATSPDGAPPASTSAPARDEDEAASEGDGGEDAASVGAPGDFDPDERILCSDDTCTGLVGPDGRCKECGKPYQP